MKLYLLLALVGFAGAIRPITEELKWNPGTEYVYSYSGRLLTGLPELAVSHFSGMAIQCQVHLTAHEDNLMTLRVLNPKYTKVNDVLQQPTAHQEGRNWRYLTLPNYSPVPEQTRQMLETPTVFRLAPGSGQVESVTVSAEEQEWSKNFKKALIVLFQTQNAPAASVTSNSLSGFINDEVSSPNFWSTMEQSLDGVCKVRYEVFEMPESIIYEEEEEVISGGSASVRGICGPNQKVYEMIKTRDVNECVHRNSFAFSKPGTYECHHGLNRTGNCGGMWSRSSITRYVLCGVGEVHSGLVIKKIVNEGELQQDLLGFRSEKMLTGTRQVLTLTSQRPAGLGGRVSHPPSPVQLNNLFHEYEKEAGASIKKFPGATAGRAAKESHKGDIKQEIKELIKEVIKHDFFTHEGLPETQITSKALGLAEGFRSLEKEDMESLYRELKSQFSSESERNVFKNVFFDTSVMSGTTESVRFIKKMILEGETTYAQAESLLLSWSRYLVTPHARILEEIYELVTSPKVRQMSQQDGGNNVYNSAILGFSNLLQQACLSSGRNVTYPIFIYGEFCSKDSYIVEGKWIPYLDEKIRSNSNSAEEQHVYVVALALLAHKNVLPTLNYVINHPEKYSPTLRTLAVYAHTGAGHNEPERARSTLSAIYFNQAERTEVRAAAFTVILKLKPEMYLLQKVATLTWNETDYEILKLVNTAFYSISEATALEDVKPSSSRLVRQIRLIYPLIKKTGGKFPTTGSYYVNDYLTQLNVGFERSNIWITPKESSTPAFYYNKLTYLLDELRFTPLEYGINTNGAEGAVKEILKIITGKKSGGQDAISSKWSKELQKMVEQLKMKKSKETGRAEGNFYINFLENTPIFYSFAEESAESLKQKVRSMAENPGKLIKKMVGGSGRGNEQVSYQRLVNMAPAVYIIPSDMGFPISMEINMPIVFSAQGTLEPEVTNTQVTVKSKVQVMAALQYIGWVGTVDPFDHEYVVTGIDQHVAINLPAQLQVEFNGPEQTITFDAKPIVPASRNPETVDVYHYHVRPYTVTQKLWKIRPMTLNPKMKIIKSSYGNVMKNIRTPVLESLGLGLELNVKTQSNMNSISEGFMKKLEMYNYNPFNMLRFTWVSSAYSPDQKPSVRLHVIKLKYNPNEATTKEIKSVIKLGVASKEVGQRAKYHAIKTGSRSLEMESKPIGSHARHEERMQKIEEMIEKTKLHSGYAFNIDWKTQLLGQATRNIHWSFSAGLGSDAEVKTVYNVHLETNNHGKVCLRGHVDLPLSSSRFNIHKIRSGTGQYKFESIFGFGSSCQDKEIRVEGSSHTSGEQIRYSETSKESKEYQRLVNERAHLAHLSEAAEKVRRQASTLDEVEYTVTYKNLPEFYLVTGERFIEFLKVYWMTSLEYSPVPSSGIERGAHSGKIEYFVRFHPENGTFALKIDRSSSGQPNLYFNDIQLPAPISYFFPLSSVNPTLPLTKTLAGGSGPIPTCSVEGKNARTFDGKTVPFLEDGCFTLLAADKQSPHSQWGVFLRSGPGSDKPRTLRTIIEGSKIEVTFEGEHELFVKLNDGKLDLPREKSHPIIVGGKKLGYISRSADDTITFSSTYLKFEFHFDLLKLSPSLIYKNDVSGLCGNMNSDKKDDLLTPGMCLVSDAKVLSASYRVPQSSPHCKPLPAEIKEKLRKETEEFCLKPRSVGSSVSRVGGVGIIEGESGLGYPEGKLGGSGLRGTAFTNLIYELSGQGKLCFSKRPHLECTGSSRPAGYRRTEVAYHCFEKSCPKAQEYAARIRSGEPVPELANMPTSFTREVPIPKACMRTE